MEKSYLILWFESKLKTLYLTIRNNLNCNNKKAYLKFNEVSYEFRELFILTGYRVPNSSLSSCIKSLFSLSNNESINFWTHFVPFLFSFYTLVSLCFIYDILSDDFVWPLFIYLTTICFYLLMSSIAHALNCMSPIARHICFILDYLSISIYGMGCTIAYRAYSLSTIQLNQKEKFFDYYVLLALCFSLFANVISCASRFVVSHPKRNFLRAVSFITQYLFVNVPLIYRFMFFYYPIGLNRLGFLFSFLSSSKTEILQIQRDQSHNTFGLRNESDIYYIMQFGAAIASAILYIFHVPERIWPGKFDLIGQSHQIFHLTSFMCTWSQFTALKVDMTIESSSNLFDWKSLNNSTLPYFELKLSYSTIMFCCILLNSLILVYYYFKAVYFNPWKEHNGKLLLNGSCSCLNAKVYQPNQENKHESKKKNS